MEAKVDLKKRRVGEALASADAGASAEESWRRPSSPVPWPGLPAADEPAPVQWPGLPAPPARPPAALAPPAVVPATAPAAASPAVGPPAPVPRLGPKPPLHLPPLHLPPLHPGAAPLALPPRPGFFARYWPVPVGPAHPVALACMAAVALTAAFLLTVSRPGLGWLLVGAVAATGLTLVARTNRIRLPLPRLVWGAAALALLAVGTVRAAGWLFLLCVPTAAICGSIALAGGRNARGLLLGALATPAAAVRGVAWFGRGTAALHNSRASGRWLRLAAAAGVGLALLLVFGALFVTADHTFNELVIDDLRLPDGSAVFGAVVRFVIFGWGALGAAYLASRPPTLDRLTDGRRRPVRRVEWLLPVVLLDLLFAAFVAVQLRVFVGGNDYVLETSGLTYAEYARSGFWQLVTVTVLTLAVIAVAVRKAPRANRGDRLALRLALGTLAALTLVVVASALMRMAAYEDAYGLTRLRLLVAACELWLGLVFVLVLAAGVRLRDEGRVKGGWVGRSVIGAGIGMLLALAVLNPDRLIADRNIDRFERGGTLDVQYLAGLSPDAAPALDRLPEAQRSCALWRMAAELNREPDAWYEFNWGRWTARDIEPRVPSARCSSSRW